ncbi:hypothetical protein DL93DRAFT_2122995 [Clavulina sp. PMI_390]|nr:hypothetical protein DL93DRAFT_2122995 [Clavulina sp. PMI_390]
MKITLGALIAFASCSLINVVTARMAQSIRPAHLSAKRSSDGGSVTDSELLQYLLTIEHVQSAFYDQALASFNASSFVAAGLTEDDYNRFAQIAHHEAQHVVLLQEKLGSSAVAACNYTFPIMDVTSFVALASVLENAGISAYLSAVSYLSDKNYLNVANTIMTTEARHQAWVSGSVQKVQPWSGAEDTPLTLSTAYSIMASYITSCPDENASLLPSMLTKFPTLTASPSDATPGTSIKYTFTPSDSSTGTSDMTAYWATHYSGLSVESVQLDASGSAVLPASLLGTYYTTITTSATNISDTNTVAGPLVSTVNFAANVTEIDIALM